MKKKKIKSVVPIYGVGLVWISCALSGNLSSFGQIIRCVFLSLVAHVVLKLFFPDRMAESEEQSQQTKKTEPKQKQPPQSETKKSDNPELDEVLQQGEAAIRRIQELNDEIPDYKLSAQIKQIEILTEKIFDCLRTRPQNLREVRQFLNYYLPTTIKLLEQYVVLQNQGMRMGNIEEGMQKIEQMLDKVIVAFQHQLDGLFESDVVDITADIQVMEQMMASEGLTNQNDFKERS